MDKMEIGLNAGKVWQLLCNNEKWSYGSLKRKSGLKDKELGQDQTLHCKIFLLLFRAVLSLFRKPFFSFSLFPRVIDGCLPFILYIYYIQDYFLYYILVCLSKVFQRTIFSQTPVSAGKRLQR